MNYLGKIGNVSVYCGNELDVEEVLVGKRTLAEFGNDFIKLEFIIGLSNKIEDYREFLEGTFINKRIKLSKNG